ncbi:Bcr/CflA family efflux MFS transporter [Paenibacillus sp. 1011MAR3C5]|uniref:multidrug effflux MFS transporter n=1 Tax=Paenibacillus sp. 1011MAR3C5 TaxID=1675787 RepID=UPI000E6B9AD1|nr:multidrug effflux MFS transporter [Paenibacillus sp. 1011MAR3C5]RJE88545.1 Bcr/CflA family efflux MFS transporter [Paenibacillus sp. 1011MAR3C5]
MNTAKSAVNQATTTPVGRSKRLWIALILGALSGIGPLSIDMYLPALPTLAGELGASASVAQLSLTACLLGIALGQLIVGPISDVTGRRKPLLIGIAVYAVVSLLCVISPNIWTFIALRFVQGLAGAAGIVIARASVRDLYSGVELTKFFALLMLINGAAPILAPMIGAEILNFTSWRGVFAVLSVSGLLMMAAIYFGLKETLPMERRQSGGLGNTLRIFRKLTGDRVFMGYAMTQGFMMAAMFAYISGSSFVLQEIYNVTPRTYSYIFGLNGIGIIIASQIAGRLAGKVEARKLLISGLAMAGCGSVLLLATAFLKLDLPMIVAGFFLVVSSLGITSATTTSLALQDQGQTAGSASALLGMLSFIFGGLAAPLVGLGGEGTAVPLAIVISSLVLAAFVCYVLLTKRK